MSSKALIYAILLVMMIYEAYMCLARKQGTGKKMIEKYTKESLAKYSLFGGIGCILAAVMCLVILLPLLGVVDYGFDPAGDSAQAWILRGILIAAVLIPYIIGWRMLVKKEDGKTFSKEKGKKKEEDEDF